MSNWATDFAERRAAIAEAGELRREVTRLATERDAALWMLAERDAARGACTAAALQDAERYAFAKTLEGQIVVMETLKSHGAEALDQALDDAMAEELENRDE